MTRSAIDVLREKKEANNQIVGDGRFHLRLKKLMYEHKLNLESLSKKVNIPEDVLEEYIDNDFITIDLTYVLMLASFFKKSKDYLLYGKKTELNDFPNSEQKLLQEQNNTSQKQAPQKISSELKSLELTDYLFYEAKIEVDNKKQIKIFSNKDSLPMLKSQEQIKKLGINPKNCFVFQNFSAGMDPIIKNGDRVLIERLDNYSLNGQIYLIYLLKNFCLCRLNLGFKTLSVYYDHPDFPKETIPYQDYQDKLMIIGRAVSREGDLI